MNKDKNTLEEFEEKVQKTVETFSSHERMPETVNGEIYSELDWMMNEFSDYEIIKVFKEYVDLELDENMSVADIRLEVEREAFREIKAEVCR